MLYISFILLIAYETNFVEGIIKFFKLERFFYLEEYVKEKLVLSHNLNYFEFLSIYKPMFITKLLSCAICLCFWLTVLLSILKIIFMIEDPIIQFINFPLYYFSNLFVYLVIKKLL